ncbi:MAG: hypothetical protein ACOC88_02490 [Candidatus Bipolaricaulota bacterium]
MSDEDSKASLQFGGGTYGLFGIGVGLAASHLGFSIFTSIVWGVFWPVPLGYWLVKALHGVAL